MQVNTSEFYHFVVKHQLLIKCASEHLEYITDVLHIMSLDYITVKQLNKDNKASPRGLDEADRMKTTHSESSTTTFTYESKTDITLPLLHNTNISGALCIYEQSRRMTIAKQHVNVQYFRTP